MQAEGFRVTREFEESHWWFRSRRDLIRMQVNKAAAELGAPDKRLRILDFGCGTGFNLSLLAEFGEVSGADRLHADHEQFRLAHGFPMLDVAEDLPANQGRFELVTAFDVLEHIDDDVAGLRTLEGLLAPSGQILLTVPAYQWLWGGEDVISEHRRRYTETTLRRCVATTGLKIEFISYFNLSILPMMTSVIWARRLLASGVDTKSSLSTPPSWLNEALYNVTAREAALVGSQSLRMPAGASIVCRLGRGAA
jgi:SAM-dependent methyltransferase